MTHGNGNGNPDAWLPGRWWVYGMATRAVQATETATVTGTNGRGLGLTTLEHETPWLYTQGLRLEGPGEDVREAQKVFELVVQTEPDFFYAWTNLGYMLTSLGNLDQALLCYNKATSLRPPPEALAATVLNRASIYMATNRVCACCMLRPSINISPRTRLMPT